MKIDKDRFFVTADTHYSHRNICSSTTEWMDKDTRQFASIDAMNNTIVNRINEKVPHDGVLFHLGDWSFGGIAKIAEFRHRLNVREIHLILGNHDHHMEAGRELDNFTSVQYYKEITVNNQLIILFHYGMRVWRHNYKGSWHLYGHSHGSLPSFGQSMDVGVDTHDFKPYSFGDLQILKKNKIEIVDHHE